MTTIQISPAAGQLAPTRTALAVPMCGCGQDLDGRHGQHCPRCGRTLHGEPAPMIPAA